MKFRLIVSRVGIGIGLLVMLTVLTHAIATEDKTLQNIGPLVLAFGVVAAFLGAWLMARRGRAIAHRQHGGLAWRPVTALLLAVAATLGVAGVAFGHNLQTRMVYMFLDPATQTMLDNRIAAPSWSPPQPLLQVNDEVGLIIKVVPRDGTTTGVGGYVDFYVPNGVTVLDAAYVRPNSSGNYDRLPIKGQSLIAIGDGPIGTNCTPALAVGGPLTLGPNVIGTTAAAVTATTGCHNGTIAGVYGDTGIFYSTDPDTAYGSWQQFTGDWNANVQSNICGSKAFYPTANGKTLTNNSGDVVVPCNKWDAEQLYAYGVKGTTYTGSGTASVPIVDPNGRGNSPWGNASAVAGPQSGYAWDFDWDSWRTSAKTMKQASSQFGPWKRIRYEGSMISKDQPGLKSTVLGVTGISGSTTGFALAPNNPLASTVSQTDSSSPKAVRYSIGQLTQFVPEYVWVKIRIDNTTAIMSPDGCPYFYGDTFGGDAGGNDIGKDHLWRYYEPTRVTWNGCVAMGKPTNRTIVKVGDAFQYNIKIYNAGNNDLTNVVVRDTLPSGVTFVSAVPAQNTGPNPLVWNVGTLLRGQKFEAVVTVKATSVGALDNTLSVSSNQLPTQTVTETQISGTTPILDEGKSVSPTSVAPGGTVQYTVTVKNIGTGATASPLTLSEYLPAGFTYVSKDNVTVNGANVTASTTVNTANTNQPIFTIPSAINAGQSLVLKFTALVGTSVVSGSYCNQYTLTQNGIPATTGALACVDVGGGRIGDTIYRDWNGNGAQDTGEEGIPGVVVELRNGVCTPGVNCPTTTTDANGNYLFNGLNAGTYTVAIISGIPAGYTPKQDPDGGTANQAVVTLTANQANLNQDFGYQPGGTGSIGDKVFEDKNNDGTFNGSDVGINGVLVTLYEDTNGNGVIDSGDLAIQTTTTSGGGNYLFTGLATGLSYLVKVEPTNAALVAYFPGTFSGSTANPQPVPNLSGAYLNADIGFYGQTPGSIGDQVWLDANGNGVFDSGETGLGGVTVKLYRDANNDGIPDAGEYAKSTTVAPNGTYLFSNLGPDKYIVVIDSTDPNIPAGYFGPYQSNVTLTAGQNYTLADFPYVAALTKSVSPTGATTAGSTLTYTITPRYPGFDLLSSAVVNDTIPAGTTYVANSANAGGDAIDDTDPPDGVIDSVEWDLGSNSIDVRGSKGGAPPAGCSSTTTTFTAIADTHLNKGNTTQWNGSSTTIQVNSDATNTLSGLVTFDLSSIPVGSSISTANLNLVVTAGAAANRQFNVYRMTTGWTEGTSATNGATWSDPNGTGTAGVWTTSGGSFGTGDYNNSSLGQINPTANGTYTLDIKTTVTSWVNGTANSGLALVGVGSNTTTVSMGSKEGAAGNRPTLDITYTPNGCSGTTIIQRSGASGTVFDTDIDKANPTTWTSSNNRLRTQPADSSNLRYALVKFDLSSIPAGATINSATMRVEVRTRKNNHVDQIYRLTTDWVPGTSNANGATWNDPNGTGTAGVWATSGGAFGSSDYNATLLGSITPSTTGAKTLSLTNQVRNWYNGTHANYGLVFLATGSDTGEVQYYSSEEGTVSRRPSLTVNWSIEPSGSTGNSYLTAGPTLVQNGDTITVRMTLNDTAGSALTNVAPSALTVTGTNSASATCGSPSPSTVTVPGNGSATFTWTCTASVPANSFGNVTFSASASNGTVAWSAAKSNSVIVARPLTFQVQVKNPPGVSAVANTATFPNNGGINFTSNTTQNPLTASIGDRVWNDINGDGLETAGEPGLQGVTVCATPTAGGSPVCATTDATGAYRIYGLTNGTNYNVTYTLPNNLSGYQATTPTTLPRAATTAGVNDADFGLRAPAGGSIGDTVWLDANSDGVLDPGEKGLAGIAVKLYDSTGTKLLATTTTDANGNYIFTGLYAGTYKVQVDTASAVTTPYGVNTTIGASMTATTGTTNPRTVTLATNSTVITDADFGYNWGGSIGDYAWYDNNGNTNQDPNNPGGGQDEGGAPNTTIVLYYDTNGDGKVSVGEPVVAVTVTDNNGAYLFSKLPPGNYVVKADEQQVPAPPSSANAGTIGTMVATTGSARAVGLAANQNYTTADFGFIEGSEVAGHVFHDVNGNGILEAGEARLANVTVTLTGTDLSGNPVSRTTTTDASGEYSFVVPPGNYTIAYNTSDPDIPAGLTFVTTPTSFTISVPPGAEMSGYDFGRDNPGSIGDIIFNDANGNGVQNAGEAGIPGVTVNLYDNANNYITSAVTDSSGKYLFTGLADGTYKVVVDTTTLPTGYVQKADPDQSGVTCTTCDSTSNTTISGGNSVLTKDFGYQSPGTTYSVSGTIWKDNNGNGVNNSEPGIQNVTVTLTYTDPSNNTLTVTVPVDSNGNYSVSGIPNGSTVTVTVNTNTLPNGSYVQTGDPDQPGVPCTTCNNTTTFTVSGANVTGKDFGYQEQVGSIAGKVVIGNGNGIADNGETPLQNVTIKLYYAATLNDPFTLLDTKTTAADGTYSFTNLLPGYYQIVEINPPSYASVGDRDMGSNLDNISLTLSAGQNITGRDFEDAVPTSLVLQDMHVASKPDGIVVRWTTALEMDLIGFNVWRAQGDFAPEMLNTELISALSPGQLVGNEYSFTDSNVTLETQYVYKLEIVRAGPLIEWSEPILVTFDGGSSCLNPPNRPVLLSPGKKATVKKKARDLTWGADSCSSATYNLVVREGNHKGKVIANPKALTEARGRVNKLEDGKTYVWRVQVCTGQDSCTWSKWRRFEVKLAPSTTKSRISGQVRLDADGNGKPQDVETGIPGIPITLFTDPNGDGDARDGVEVSSQLTLSSGEYLFKKVPAGTYVIVITTPSGYNLTFDTTARRNGKIPVTVQTRRNSQGNDFLLHATSVVLSGFAAEAKPTDVTVKWSTTTELDVVGFNIARTQGDGADVKILNGDKLPAKSPGQMVGNDYVFTDADVTPGSQYTYKLEVIRLGDITEWSEATAVTFVGENACQTAPEVPTLLLPKDDGRLKEAARMFTWKAVACSAATYGIIVREQNPKGKVLVKSAGLTKTEFRVKGLEDAKSYVWRVQACTANNVCTWSDWRSFQVKLGK